MPSVINKVLAVAKKEKLFTISNLVVMTLTFLVLGFFILLEVFSQTALNKLEKEAVVTIFFKDEVSELQILDIKSNFEKDERVFNVNYVSKDDAFAIFQELNKNEPLLLESVTANVLPASLEVKAVRVAVLSDLAGEYSQIEGVEGVKYFADIIERFNFWRMVLSVGVGMVLLILLFVSFSIVVSTVRTAISVRGSEYEILKLVGASDAFVKDPLKLQGVLYGGISSFVAAIFYAVLLTIGLLTGVFVSLGISEIIIFPSLAFPLWVFTIFLVIILTVSGTLLGLVSSVSAVKKYLNY